MRRKTAAAAAATVKVSLVGTNFVAIHERSSGRDGPHHDEHPTPDTTFVVGGNNDRGGSNDGVRHSERLEHSPVAGTLDNIFCSKPF